jgi:hypothetical protein
MKVKVENQYGNLPRNIEGIINGAADVIPAEHLRWFNKVVLVETITEPRLSEAQRANLPALYHPREGGQAAWGEIAVSILFPKKRFPKNLMSRLTLKSNTAQVVLSLVAQHYHLTLSKGIKKTQLESACRSYVEKYFEKWREKQGGLRVKLLKPFKPQLDRWARKLAKKYGEELKKNRAQQK